MKDAIENLARDYLEIRREGCIQFDKMYIEVDCSQLAEAAVKFKLYSIKKAYSGSSRSKSALAHCQDLHAYLVDCVKNWRHNMDTMRRCVGIIILTVR